MKTSGYVRSSGFTLIELLIVMVVIGLLMALLLPAIGGAMRSARNAAVSTEVGRMAQSLTEFAGKYGTYPPSRILLVENGDYSPTNFNYLTYTYSTPSAVDVTTGALVQRSLAHLRKFFPRLDLGTSGATRGPGTFVYTHGDTSFYDFNGNGKLDPPVLLTGDECLVFFLGGMAQVTPSAKGNVYSMSGFAADPRNPFQPVSMATNRIPPTYEFDPGRLVDFDGDGYPSYCDSLKTVRPLAYFSGYGGTGYDVNDCNFDTGNALAESDDALTVTPITLAFRLAFPVKGGGSAISPPPNPYSLTSTTVSPVVWLKPQGFQLISAGADGLYGVGGAFDQDASNPLPVDAANTKPGADVTIRFRERDNLTNFHGSKLD